MTYIIDSIIDRKTGEPTERHHRRVGHRVEITWLKKTEPMILRYIDEGSMLITSSVVDHRIAQNGSLVVTTKNTFYTFKPEENE